ncbi:glycosyltransferase [Virgibacillus phasianinus]|nr:glycosyltransferase [Virgibacillus phasianinus]
MKAVFVHSHIFKYDNDYNFYSDGKLTYQMWEQRYLKYFDNLIVAARAKRKLGENLNISSGNRVEHIILPSLSKIKGRYKNKSDLKKKLKTVIEGSDALIARMPSEHAYLAIKIAKRLNKPYTVEIVGDVFSSFWTHGSVVGKLLAPIYYFKYRKVIKQSAYLIYVTKNNLQKKYPYNSSASFTNISNVDLPSVSDLILFNRLSKINKLDVRKEVNIGLIGSYSSKYKGIDRAIKSIKQLNSKGLKCNLIVLGEGNNRWLLDLSKKLNVENNVVFLGSLPGGKEVFEWLDNIDLYIQPSLTEGLPRSLIEAMSRGLPCVASSVGGIPELIDKKFIHNPKSYKELSEKIFYLLSNKKLMLEQAKKNYSYSKSYTSDVLNERRKDFWVNFNHKEFSGK